MKSSIFEQIGDTIRKNNKFKQDFGQLIRNEFPPRTENITPLGLEQIKKLLETAAIFSLSHKDEHQKIALKISFFLLNQYKKSYPIVSYVAELVLTRLGDIPTIKHMLDSRDGNDYFSYFAEQDKENKTETSLLTLRNLISFPEILEKKVQNQFNISQREISFTDFQSSVYQNLKAREKRFLFCSNFGWEIIPYTDFYRGHAA